MLQQELSVQTHSPDHRGHFLPPATETARLPTDAHQLMVLGSLWLPSLPLIRRQRCYREDGGKECPVSLEQGTWHSGARAWKLGWLDGEEVGPIFKPFLRRDDGA